MDSLKSLLGHNKYKTTLKRAVDAAIIVDVAKNILTNMFPLLESSVEVVSVRNYVLSLRISSSAFSSQIRIKKNYFLRLLNEKIGTETVRELRFLPMREK